MVEDVLKYSVGALLYCPALNTTVADSILSLEKNILCVYVLKIQLLKMP